MKNIILSFITLLFASNVFAVNLTSSEIKKLSSETKIKNIISAQSFDDINGKHTLVFTKDKSFIKSTDGSDGLDVIQLAVKLISEKDNKKIVEWYISDKVECPGLDIDANFVPKATQVVDLKNTGEKSVVIAYTMFCGGGVDPSTLKLIYKNKTEKFALRGTTEISYGAGEYKSGGEVSEDAIFKSAPVEVKTLLKKTWNKIKFVNLD